MSMDKPQNDKSVDGLEAFLAGRHAQYYELHQTDDLDAEDASYEDGYTLAIYIEEARSQHELSQIELAEATGFSTAEIHALEQGLYPLWEINEAMLRPIWEVLQPELPIDHFLIPTTPYPKWSDLWRSGPLTPPEWVITLLQPVRPLVTSPTYMGFLAFLIVGTLFITSLPVPLIFNMEQDPTMLYLLTPRATLLDQAIVLVQQPNIASQQAIAQGDTSDNAPTSTKGVNGMYSTNTAHDETRSNYDAAGTDDGVLFFDRTATELARSSNYDAAGADDGFSYSYSTLQSDISPSYEILHDTADTAQVPEEITAANAIRKVGTIYMTPGPEADAYQVIDKIGRIVIANGGTVSSEQTEASSQAHFQTRLGLTFPPNTFDLAWRSLTQLDGANILVQEMSQDNVYADYVDLQAQLANAQLQESELREFLSEAREEGHSVTDVLRISDRVTEARGLVEQLQGRITVLENGILESKITIIITTPEREEKPPPPPEEESVTIQAIWQEAWGASVRFMMILVTMFIWIAAYSPIILAVLAFVWWLIRLARRSQADAD